MILGQGMPNKFTNNTPSGRKELLEKLSKSDFMIEDIKNKLSARKNELSENRYIKLIASSPILKPTITYALPDVLSCTYDIGVVFVPMNLTKNGYSSSIAQKDGRVDVELRDDYLGETYKFADIHVDGSRIDTVWITKGHNFKYCDYYPNRTKITDSKLTLKITGTVKRNETTSMSRDMYIDCIVLRPQRY